MGKENLEKMWHRTSDMDLFIHPLFAKTSLEMVLAGRRLSKSYSWGMAKVSQMTQQLHWKSLVADIMEWLIVNMDKGSTAASVCSHLWNMLEALLWFGGCIFQPWCWCLAENSGIMNAGKCRKISIRDANHMESIWSSAASYFSVAIIPNTQSIQ